MERFRNDHLGERAADLASAAILAAAAAFASARLSPFAFRLDEAAAAVSGFLFAYALLRKVPPEAPLYVLKSFEPSALSVSDDSVLEELILTEGDRLAPRVPDASCEQKKDEHEELLLDDPIEPAGPASRVVRLFDRQPLPTAGELKASIDRHLGLGLGSSALPDASQALIDALSELRRSLR